MMSLCRNAQRLFLLMLLLDCVTHYGLSYSVAFEHFEQMECVGRNYSQLFLVTWVKSVVTISDIFFSGITDMQVHFMFHFEKHWTPIHVLEIKKRMNSLNCMVFYVLAWEFFGAHI